MLSAEYLSEISIDLIMNACQWNLLPSVLCFWTETKQKKMLLYRKLTVMPGRKTRRPFISCLMPWISYWPKQTKSTTVWWVLIKHSQKSCCSFWNNILHNTALFFRRCLKCFCIFFLYTENVQAGKWRGQEEGIRPA